MKNWNTRVKNCRSVGLKWVGWGSLLSLITALRPYRRTFTVVFPHTLQREHRLKVRKSHFFLCNVNISFVSLPPGARKLDEWNQTNTFIRGWNLTALTLVDCQYTMHHLDPVVYNTRCTCSELHILRYVWVLSESTFSRATFKCHFSPVGVYIIFL